MSIFPEFLVKPFRPYLRAILGIQGSAAVANTVLYSSYRESLLSSERNRDPKRLLKYGFRAYSQHDEDGMISEIFSELGFQAGRFLNSVSVMELRTIRCICCFPAGEDSGSMEMIRTQIS